MPTCVPCAKHWTPSSLRADGTCPACGQVVAAPPLAEHAAAVGSRRVAVDAGPVTGGASDEEAEPKAPWHFKLLLAALVVYLGFRGVQGVEWVAGHL